MVFLSFVKRQVKGYTLRTGNRLFYILIHIQMPPEDIGTVW